MSQISNALALICLLIHVHDQQHFNQLVLVFGKIKKNSPELKNVRYEPPWFPIEVSGAFQQATNSKIEFDDPKGLFTCSNGLKKT